MAVSAVFANGPSPNNLQAMSVADRPVARRFTTTLRAALQEGSLDFHHGQLKAGGYGELNGGVEEIRPGEWRIM